MSVLRNIENRIEGLFEGVFGRAFRTHVQPVELARKLVKEMEDHRVVSVSRVYAPNEYVVYLGPADREQFQSYEESLQRELQDYIAENARRERYELLSPPEVKFETDDDLEMGEFGIATRMVQGAVPKPGEPPSEAEPGATMIYRKPVETEAVSVEDLGLGRETVSLEVNGAKHELDGIQTTIGRSKECDIQLARPERLAQARRGASGGRGLLGGRSRLHERDGGERAPPQAGEAAPGRPHHGRFHRPRLPARDGGRMTLVASIAVEEALLVLKIVFLVLLYLFIWRIVRSAARTSACRRRASCSPPVRFRASAKPLRRSRRAGSSSSRAPRWTRATSGCSTPRR